MTETAWATRVGFRTRFQTANCPVVAVATAATIAVGAVLGAGALIAARSMGVDDGSTSPALAVVGAVSAVATAGVGARLSRSTRSIGRGMSAVAALLAVYLLVCAACAFIVGLGGARGTLAELLVAVTAAWFMVPMTGGQLVVLAMARRLGARGTGPAALVLVVTAAAGLLTGFAASAPSGAYHELAAPLATLDSPVSQLLFGVLSTAWMGAVVVPGIIAWHGIRAATGTSRHRLALTAVAGILPAWTIALCLGLTPVIFWDDSGQLMAADLLAVVFAAPFPLVAVGLALADSASEDWLRRRSPGILVTAFSIAVGGIAAVIAASVGILIGITGPGAVVPAVVAAVGIAVGFGMLRGQWTAVLATRLDPAPMTALSTHGIALLSGREREVLALLSAGASNAAIAARLVVSERTVDSHVRSIFTKLGLGLDLGANRRVQAAAIWLRASTDSAGSRVSTDGGPRPGA